ncbi:hypothetical protein NE237_022269 [Protea cynaroides]|uniref:Uncharacterized protein n=1 Tax=Protea cynaroides TaxID=273540 RepID=A0A9Q0K542_9MAGN|nr:hypothetical protein NE237_022269 [Protea cynaroides]
MNGYWSPNAMVKGAMGNTELKSEDMKKTSVHLQKKGRSWAEWAMKKLSGWGLVYKCKSFDAFTVSGGATNLGSEKVSDVAVGVERKLGEGKEGAIDAYKEAKQKVDDGRERMRREMSESVYSYETAKEKLSDATGQSGAKMENNGEL